jgi:hypothetical protein
MGKSKINRPAEMITLGEGAQGYLSKFAEGNPTGVEWMEQLSDAPAEDFRDDNRFDDWIKESTQALLNCAHKGGELLCELAQIPGPCRKQFLDEVGRILAGIHLAATKLPPGAQEAFKSVETKLRAAYAALLALPPEWRFALHLLPEPLPPIKEWKWSEAVPFEDYLRRMVQTCARITGGDPHVKASNGRRGRRSGARTRATYPLMIFIWKIARAVKRHGGKLTLDRHKQRGTWIDALDGLRPLFPKGFIPHAAPLSMIEELQRKSNKKPLPA